MFFWKYRWICGFTVGEIAPLIIELVSTRARNRRTVGQALLDNAWAQDVQGELSFMAHMQVVNLCHAIATVPRNDGEMDQFHWSVDASGSYSANSVYKRL